MMMASKHGSSNSSIYLLLLFIFTLFVSAQSSQVTFQAPTIPRSTFKLTSISRNVELGGATAKAATVYSLKPSSNSNDDDEAIFVFALDGREASNLSWIEAYTGRTGNSKKPVTLERVDGLSGEA